MRYAIYSAWVLASLLDASPLAAQEGPASPAPKTITLAQARRMAVQTHPAIRDIEESVTRADLTLTRAWSILLPNVGVTGQVVMNQHEVSLAFPDFSTFDPANPGAMETEETVIQEKWQKELGIQANMTLFNPRAIPLIKNAKENAELSRLTARRKKNDLIFAVTAAYYQLHSMKEMVKVAGENLTLANEFLRQAEARMAAGQITRLDVLRAEMQVTQADKQVDDAEDAVRLARTGLAYLIGERGPFDIAGPGRVDAPTADLPQLKSRAAVQRIELKEAETAERMAKREETETWMKWLPAFDVTYNWRLSSAAGFSGENANWMLIFGAKWSLFEGGGRIAELRSRQSLSRSARSRLQQLALGIGESVEKSYIQADMKKRNVALAEEQVALAEENHQLVAKQYDAGIVTSLDMLAAATDLSDQRVRRVVEQLQYDLALLTLEKDLGEYHSLSAANPR